MKSDLFTELKNLFARLDELGFKSWLDFGQLLGAYRNGESLNWDKEIDFCIITESDEDWLKVRNIIFKQLQPQFKQAIPNKILSVKKGGWNIDFFRAVEKNKWIDFPLYPENLMSMRSFFYDELEKITLDGVEFNSPRHLDLYLQIRYGDDWSIPKVKNCRNVRKNPRHDLQTKEFKVITSGVFDLIHEGHINLLKRCNKHFDIVEIGIHSDKVVESYKRTPEWNEEVRYNKLLETGLCNKVIKNFPLVSDDEIIKDYDFIIYGRENSNSSFYKKSLKNHPILRTYNISTTDIIKSRKI